MKILVLGHKGMLGNAVYKYLSEKKYTISIIDNLKWDTKEFREAIKINDCDFIINCIGAIPQKNGINSSLYRLINIDLPIFLESTGKHIIHPSTDCEFSGKLKYPNKYKKFDKTDAVDEYGKSKALITDLILKEFKNTKIIRTSIIGHEINSNYSLLDWFLSSENDVNGFVNHYWNGVTTLTWIIIVEKIINNWNHFNVLTQVSTEPISKFNLLGLIKKTYNKKIKIKEYTTEESINKTLESDFIVDNLETQILNLKNFYKK